ncbi:MAG: hypothetical protein ACOX8G_11350 [Eubacterium sp.]|jgi:hypothetical protein
MTRYDCWFAALQGISRAHRRAFLAEYDPEALYRMSDREAEELTFFRPGNWMFCGSQKHPISAEKQNGPWRRTG